MSLITTSLKPDILGRATNAVKTGSVLGALLTFVIGVAAWLTKPSGDNFKSESANSNFLEQI